MNEVNRSSSPSSTIFVDKNKKVDCMLKLFEMKNKRILCDVIIHNDDLRLYAHSCILAANCTIFSSLLLNFSMKNPFSLELRSLTKSSSDLNCFTCFSKVLDYLYTGQIVIIESHASHLLNISSHLELHELVQACQEFLENVEPCIVIDNKDCQIPKEKIQGKNENGNPLCNMLSSDNKIINDERPLNQIQLDGNLIPDNVCDSKSCTKCKLQFSNSKKCEIHTKVFHSKMFLCLSCDFKTYKLSFMVFHLSNIDHEDVICSICLYETPDKKSLKLHLQEHKCELPFKCYNCNILFKERGKWLRHMLTHKKDYYCEPCDSSFLTKSALRSHLTLHHTSGNYVCETCGYRALYKSVLERHITSHGSRKVEKRKELFPCPVTPCPVVANSNNSIQVHLKNHSSNNAYLCDICALKFTHEKNLKRHVQTVHNQKNVFGCCRCSFKSARKDKAKIHCKKVHPNDFEAMQFFNIQFTKIKLKKERVLKNPHTSDQSKADHTDSVEISNSHNSAEHNCEIKHSNSDVLPKNIKKSYILSETTGEFLIISENKGDNIPLASFTSTNVLTIGNFREGTGSVTLNETTGVVTFNNINSESTGAVFLNESTGELSYINLGKESLNVDVNNVEQKNINDIETPVNNCSNEVDDDFLFDPFEMDIGNEDSCDGFDDIDALLFDPIETDNTGSLNVFRSKNDDGTPKVIPHLNETTGELSFDCIESQNSGSQLWESNSQQSNLQEESQESYRLLLNEFTGEFS